MTATPTSTEFPGWAEGFRLPPNKAVAGSIPVVHNGRSSVAESLRSDPANMTTLASVLVGAFYAKGKIMGKGDPLLSIITRRVRQSAKAAANQVPNNAGGYVFPVDDVTRLRRFLTLGVDSGTYYVTEQALTRDNAEVVCRLAQNQPQLVVDEAVAISEAGRAPRNNPALFALAAVAGLADDAGRRYALDQLPRVARTGTHLAQFVNYAEQFRGWGRQLRRAVGAWYTAKDADALAYQTLKYRQREGWTPRDLLRQAHPVAPTAAHAALFAYLAHGLDPADEHLESLPHLVDAYELAKQADLSTPEGRAKLVSLIDEYHLAWEMLPTEALNDPDIWRALIGNGLPITALMRQLPRLTQLGLLDDETVRERVVDDLTSPRLLAKSRLHPISLLIALQTYAAGRGFRGRGIWQPVAAVIDALDKAFYTSFGNVEPTGRRLLLALDVSGSMTVPVGGTPLTARAASAALALVTAATEPHYEILGFTAGGTDVMPGPGGGYWGSYAGTAISRLTISPRQRLDDVIKATDNLPFAGTDCALPMLWASHRRVPVDAFVIYTDSETWAGNIHPYQALRQYREQMGIAAKLVVVGMTSTGFSIADPDDAGMLDIAGFDASVPTVIADFVRQ